jgi:Acetyltransferase (GNAT) domain
LKITLSISKNIANIKATWDELLPKNHYLQSCHLQAFEQSNIEDVENYYVQIFLKEKLIGIVYLQQFSFQHKHLNFNTDKQFKSKLIKLVLPKRLPLLVCGHLFRIGYQGFYFKNELYNNLVFEAIELFNKQINYKPCGIIIKDCVDVFIEQQSKTLGYHFFNADVTMEIHRRPHWNSFDDYLKDLQKKYLQRAKKVLKAFEGIEQKLLSADEIIQNKTAIEKLYWNVVNKQTIKLGTVNANYFYELKNDLKDNFEFYALYKNDVMVGFYTFIFYNTEMETHFIGLDYEANKTHSIYFNILFFGIQKMIERQYNKLELGRTAKEAKVNVGALPKQIFNYINVKNWLAKLTLNYFLKRFNTVEDNKQMERTPLK